MLKELKFDQDARNEQLEGARIASYAVGKTLGPRGSNVAIERTFGVPMVIHDGVKVLAQICGDSNFLDNQWQNIGAKQLYKASKESNDYAGDGSTGAAILTYSILAEGHKLVAAGHNSRMLRRGILAAADAMDTELKKMATEIKTDEQKQQVASISAQDDNIGQAIAKAVELVGEGGVVTVDEIGSDLSIDYKEGMQFDQGLMHLGWVTDAQRREAVLDNPVILVTDYKISEVSQFETFLESVVGQQKKGKMLILAKDITGSAFLFLAQNKEQSGLDLVPVKAPGVGDEQEEYLRDIAILTGAKFISEKAGDDLNEVELSDLGSADRVTIGENATVIVNGHGADEDLEMRLAHINDQLNRPDVDGYKKERLRERKSKLTGGIAIIHVGNDAERREQVLDAISATKAAIAEGIVPGGETALLRARNILEDVKKTLTPEEAHGVDILYKAVEAPFRILIENTGDDAGAILAKVLEGDKGYNVVTRQMSDLIKDGVIDPVRVVRSILKQAAKHSTSMLTTEVLVALKRETHDSTRDGK
jgi:chaperonin GroEL